MSIKPHYYLPDYQAMGDCRVCGHQQQKPWHIGEEMMNKLLTFEALRYANVQRNQEWDPAGAISASFRGLELAGEVGEVCNKVKKLERERMGLPGSRTTFYELAAEIADAQITLDLLAMHYSVDIAEAVRLAFNAKSEEHGFLTRLL